ncbi:MAG: hypothetical protein AABZ69_04130, partial [Candidatus Binatota bacterium]
MKFRLPLLFDLLIIIFFVIFVYEARDWRLQARLYPWAIGITMLVLALIHIFWELKGGKKPSIQPSNAPVDFS